MACFDDEAARARSWRKHLGIQLFRQKVGKSAFPELTINSLLRAQHALEQLLRHLEWSDALFLAARDHCIDQGPKGKLGSTGSDGSDAFDRISRYGEARGWKGENVSYGPDNAL